jgi:predicted Zn-dependent protease
LAQILETEDRLKEAVQSLETVVKLNPGYAPAHYSLAQLYVKTGDRPRAIAHRKAHHELLDRERAAAEKARAELPALTFRIEPQVR